MEKVQQDEKSSEEAKLAEEERLIEEGKIGDQLTGTTSGEYGYEGDDNEEEEEEGDNEGEEDVEENKEESIEHSQPERKQDDTPKPAETVEYDEETKKLMEEAESARKEFQEVETQYLDLQKRKREIESLLNIDHGNDGEFHVLHGECYEYTDNEYTYKFCPFFKASQRPKDGGGETILG